MADNRPRGILQDIMDGVVNSPPPIATVPPLPNGLGSPYYDPLASIDFSKLLLLPVPPVGQGTPSLQDPPGNQFSATPATPQGTYSPGWPAPSLTPWQVTPSATLSNPLAPPPGPVMQQPTAPQRPSAWTPDNGQTVFVRRPGEGVEMRTGGSRAWRDNNPGNLYETKSAEIGHYFVPSSPHPQRHAIFDSPEAGAASRERFVFRDLGAMSLGDMVKRYASGPKDDPEQYLANIIAQTRLDPTVSPNSLNEQQRAALMAAIGKNEGWTPGKSYYYNLFGY
jgi:hypothetical protein